MNALHLQAMDIVRQLPDSVMEDVVNYLARVVAIAEKQSEQDRIYSRSNIPDRLGKDFSQKK